MIEDWKIEGFYSITNKSTRSLFEQNLCNNAPITSSKDKTSTTYQ
jgi:hypothetical protein